MSYLGAQNSIALGVQGLIHIDTGVVGSADYLLNKSLRFRSSASAYLSRTPAVAGNQKTWTISGWFKRGQLGVRQQLITVGAGGGTAYFYLNFNATDTLEVNTYDSNAGVAIWDLITTQVFRDPAAWYHIVVAADTTQSTASDRIKVYVNGNQITAFSTATYPTLNYDTRYNINLASYINSYLGASSFYDGETAELNSVDGQALAPTAFGATGANSQWLPKAYTGTYGTNGFYLPFTNTTSTTTLVADSSGNANNWTPNNISLTAGSTYDSLTDVPTLTSTTVANYAVLNPLWKGGSINPINGNLEYLNTATAFYKVFSTIGITSGKWYVEYVIVASSAIANGRTGAGLARYDEPTSNYYGLNYTWGSITNAVAVSGLNVTRTTTLSAFVAGDVLMMAYDADSGKLWFGAKGVWDGGNNPSTGSTPSFSTGLLGSTGPFFFGVQGYTAPDDTTINFGQQPFTYTPPTGFLPLNTFNI